MKKQSAAALSVLLLSAGLLCGASTVSAEIPTKPFDIPDGGLRFRFDGDAEEASGAVSGRLRGNPRFVEGRDGTPDGAIYFETDNQAVELGLDDIEGNWTASFWVRQTRVPHHVFLCSSITGSLRGIQDDGKVGATMNGIIDRSVPYEVPNDTWTMLTFAYDDDMEITSVYINGEFFDGMYGWQTLGLTLIGNDAPEQKGWQSAPEFALDDTWFFPRLLSDEEILTLYETNEAPPPPVPEETDAPETEPLPEEVPQDAETAEIEAEPEIPEDEDLNGSEDWDLTDDPVEGTAVRERKPGGFFAMGAVLLAALFLVCASGRALFGRRSG